MAESTQYKTTQKEQSAGAVIVRFPARNASPARIATQSVAGGHSDAGGAKNSSTQFLLLHYPRTTPGAKGEYWDLPKGHIEGEETAHETALREIEEETGLTDITFIEGFEQHIHYYFVFRGKKISKTVTFFLAQTNQEDVTISFEHLGYVWLPYEEALKKLTYENTRKTLRGAYAVLQEQHLV